MEPNPFVLSVPSSNPTSKFSRYEIAMGAPRTTADVEYELRGVYPDPENGPGHFIARIITTSRDRQYLKQLLIDINGPIQEEDEEDLAAGPG